MNEMVVKKTLHGKVTVDGEPYVADYQKTGKTALLRQVNEVTSIYPNIRVGNSKTKTSLFTQDDFDVENKEYTNKDNRTAFLNVPDGVTAEQLQSMLPETCCIYKILSCHVKDVLTQEQIDAANNPDLEATWESFADKKAVRYGKDHELEGELILHNGHPQYKATYYADEYTDDEDHRDNEDKYMSPNLAAEIAAVKQTADQTI
jgi:hypothetical protein